MYLKALEIQGFKSFPEKTRLSFENDITAIVGPNGSGKSNISDAILWVTGEQSSKALRGAKMEDVIFGGTERRSAMGYAQVTLFFDNTERVFDIDCDEVTIARRYFRSGESEYSINRETVRLKDIHSLLMDTGLGRDGYSIIGQGRIADIVSTKSTDRREVFEEAAGISRFRYRKEEAENRLNRADENLVRIKDRIEELELQVGPLKQQAETAKKYLLLRDELRVREVSVWMETLDRLKTKSADIITEFEDVGRRLGDARADLEALYASSENLTERMKQKESETEGIRGELAAVQGGISTAEADCAVINAEIKNNAEKMQRLFADIAEQEKRTEELNRSIEENRSKVAEAEENIRRLTRENEKNGNIINGCKMKMSTREAVAKQAREGLDRIEADMNAVSGKIHILAEMEKEYEGYSKAVRFIMRESERGSLRGVFGPVADLIDTDGEFALAVETALGPAAQHIIVDTQKTGRNAIELLKKNDSGRATFLPVDTIRAREFPETDSDDPGLVGIASELVSCDDSFREIINDLLGGTLVTETLSDAIRVSNSLENRVKIVSLDGQLINPGGSMTGGSASKSTGVLSRKNELRELRSELTGLQGKQQKQKEALDKAENELNEIRYQLQVALEDSTELANTLASFNAEKRATEALISQFNALLFGLSGDSEERRNAIKLGEEKEAELKEKLEIRTAELGTLHETESQLKQKIAAAGEHRSELEDKRSKAEKDAQLLSESIVELERTSAKIEQRRQASEMEEKQILDRMWDSYELSHTAATALRQPVESMQKATKEISRLRGEISELGTPNLGAIDEYARVSTRYDFLTEQRDDVLKAEAELKKIISDITAEMTVIFRESFDRINEEFRKTFLELFGGGKAALVLEDENNILECGIDIRVQPPGKALSTISLLSGGEMAFVAIALYFAIMKVRPTPFCVMDEIEAALDEANVSRFAEYLRKMSPRTQFLVITHRRGTMEEADMLYGVTMQEKGVSSVIRLNLENAEKLQEKKS